MTSQQNQSEALTTRQDKPALQGAFLVTPSQALDQLRQIQAVVKEVMQKDEHYGVIPGTKKPTLLKPGAELLNNMYGYFPSELEVVSSVEQWDVPISSDTFPLFRYIIRCVLKNASGLVIAVGIGECNSYEEKYRYRKSSRVCPNCHKDAIIKGKEEYGGGWLCYKNKGGCGSKFRNDDPLMQVETGKSPNDQIHSIVNTILKMAKKRAYVDATLSATRTSGMFTQDIEDMPHIKDVEEVPHTVVVDQGSPAPAANQAPPPPPAKPVQPKPGVTAGQEFDPTQESPTSGKYAGVTWKDIPADYLTWVKNNTKGANAKKAEATLKYLAQIESVSEKGDPFLGVFDAPGQEGVPF